VPVRIVLVGSESVSSVQQNRLPRSRELHAVFRPAPAKALRRAVNRAKEHAAEKGLASFSSKALGSSDQDLRLLRARVSPRERTLRRSRLASNPRAVTQMQRCRRCKKVRRPAHRIGIDAG
jgi:hypothetical protein